MGWEQVCVLASPRRVTLGSGRSGDCPEDPSGRGSPAVLLAHRQAPALEPLPTTAPAQKERRSSEVLQRPDHRTGEEVRDSEIPLPA